MKSGRDVLVMDTQRSTDGDRAMRLREIIHYILFQYPDKRVSTRRLEKLVYAAELESIDRFGHRITDLDFIRDAFGPCSHELLRTAVGEFEHETFEVEGGEGRAFRRPERIEYLHLEEEAVEILDTVHREWGDRSPDALVDHSRSTDPYKDAEMYSSIDFDKYRSCSDALYRNPQLLKDLEEASAEIREGRGTRINTEEELDEFFESL